MKGYIHNIEKAAQQNTTFRTVSYTAKNCQLVVMSLKPGEDIGAEVHKLDQFLRVEEGEGKAVLDGIEHRIKPGFAILVPAGARHNIINGPSGPMKLYTLYAPPNHHDGVVHVTKADAEADKEHFDGKTDHRIAISPASTRRTVFAWGGRITGTAINVGQGRENSDQGRRGSMFG
jgi:mannose-6-phosphate isomerase-like protein (cupin superfamily)